MKKLSLNALKSNAESVLAKDELKTIKGGGGESCTGWWYTNGGWYSGTGYTVECRNSSGDLTGIACSSGCVGSYENAIYNCSVNGYSTDNVQCTGHG